MWLFLELLLHVVVVIIIVTNCHMLFPHLVVIVVSSCSDIVGVVEVEKNKEVEELEMAPGGSTPGPPTPGAVSSSSASLTRGMRK